MLSLLQDIREGVAFMQECRSRLTRGPGGPKENRSLCSEWELLHVSKAPTAPGTFRKQVYSPVLSKTGVGAYFKATQTGVPLQALKSSLHFLLYTLFDTLGHTILGDQKSNSGSRTYTKFYPKLRTHFFFFLMGFVSCGRVMDWMFVFLQHSYVGTLSSLRTPPQCKGIRSWCLWELIGVRWVQEGRALRIGIISVQRACFPSLLFIVWGYKKSAVCCAEESSNEQLRLLAWFWMQRNCYGHHGYKDTLAPSIPGQCTNYQ